MAEDIIDRLKTKEEEIEAYINDTKKRAALIKEEALKRARELKNLRLKEIEREIISISDGEEEKIKAEIERIEKEGAEKADALKKSGLKNRDRAVKELIRYIVEGV